MPTQLWLPSFFRKCFGNILAVFRATLFFYIRSESHHRFQVLEDLCIWKKTSSFDLVRHWFWIGI